MHLIVGDFETYYSQTYSLTKLTTEAYIRGDEFEAIGVSIKVGDAPAEWFSGTHKEIKQWLQQFDWGDAMFVAHNNMFDAAILSWIFDIHPKALADTLSMARAVHGIEVGGSLAKLAEHYGLGVKGTEVVRALGKHRLDFTAGELAAYGDYCVNDTELTYKLFRVLGEGYPPTEMKLIDLTLKMFTEPVLELDAFLLEQHLSAVRAKKEELLAQVLGADPLENKKNIMSNPKFAVLLREQGVEPPMKTSRTTGNPTFAFAKTDEGMQELLEHPNLYVQTLASVRLGVKGTIEETRTERFLDIAQRGNLPIPLKYYAAHTSRWGGSDKVNLQNLPSRGDNAGTLKKCIRAPEGYIMIDCDSSQIEARMLAWMAGQDDLVETFRLNNEEIANGVPKDQHQHDPYKIMASAIYGVPVNEVTAAQRFIGKTVILGAGYGLGAKKFQIFMQQVGVILTLDECYMMINTYRQTFDKIPQLWNAGDLFLGALVDDQEAFYGRPGVVTMAWGLIHTPIGLAFKYPELRRHTKPKGGVEFLYKSRTGITSIWGGKFTENITQHLARAVIGEQMVRISKRYRPVLTVHDAIGIIARREEAAEARQFVEECMRWVPAWAPGLPLNCESGMGDNYGEC